MRADSSSSFSAPVGISPERAALGRLGITDRGEFGMWSAKGESIRTQARYTGPDLTAPPSPRKENVGSERWMLHLTDTAIDQVSVLVAELANKKPHADRVEKLLESLVGLIGKGVELTDENLSMGHVKTDREAQFPNMRTDGQTYLSLQQELANAAHGNLSKLLRHLQSGQTDKPIPPGVKEFLRRLEKGLAKSITSPQGPGATPSSTLQGQPKPVSGQGALNLKLAGMAAQRPGNPATPRSHAEGLATPPLTPTTLASKGWTKTSADELNTKRVELPPLLKEKEGLEKLRQYIDGPGKKLEVLQSDPLVLAAKIRLNEIYEQIVSARIGTQRGGAQAKAVTTTTTTSNTTTTTTTTIAATQSARAATPTSSAGTAQAWTELDLLDVAIALADAKISAEVRTIHGYHSGEFKVTPEQYTSAERSRGFWLEEKAELVKKRDDEGLKSRAEKQTGSSPTSPTTTTNTATAPTPRGN